MIQISVMKELNLLHYTIQYKILRTEKKKELISVTHDPILS